MARTLKPTPYHEAAAARAKADAAAAKAEADAAAAKAKAGAVGTLLLVRELTRTVRAHGEQLRASSLWLVVLSCPLAQGSYSTASRHACVCQPMADSRILPSARPTYSILGPGR